MFSGPATQRKDLEHCTTEPEVENRRWQPPKPELLIFRLMDEMETKSQLLNRNYRGEATQCENCRCKFSSCGIRVL